MTARRSFGPRQVIWILAASALFIGGAVWSAFKLDAGWWGAVGQWLGALGTFAAVWFALYLARNEALGTQVRHASLVICEARGVYESGYSPEYWGMLGGDHPDLSVTIFNHGPEPILLPRLERFVHPGGGLAGWSRWEDPTGADDGWRPEDSLAPGGRTSIPVTVTYDPELTDEQIRQMWDAIPVIGFTDAAGRGWRRQGSELPRMVHRGDNAELGGPEWYQVRRR